jgi:hypothetical protein
LEATARFSGENTGNLCQINCLHLKQSYQKAGKELDSRPIPS